MRIGGFGKLATISIYLMGSQVLQQEGAWVPILISLCDMFVRRGLSLGSKSHFGTSWPCDLELKRSSFFCNPQEISLCPPGPSSCPQRGPWVLQHPELPSPRQQHVHRNLPWKMLLRLPICEDWGDPSQSHRETL